MTTQVGNFVVFGDIEQKWLALGGLAGSLRQPISNEAPTFDGVGREQKFQGGFISWHPDIAVKAHVVWGSIGARWVAIGREQFGYPITDETPTPDGRGRFNHFRAFRPDGSVIGDSSIYWLPETDAHEIFGAIRDKWASMGWERSPLGYPVDHEQPTFDGVGRRQNFQGGMISWRPEIGAFVVWGLIGARWLEIGSEQFGYPITDETPTPDGRGRFNHFRAFRPDGSVIGDSSIYWLPEIGAHEVHGAIRDKWASLGSESSFLGYPVTDETGTPDGHGRFNHFQGGSIFWSPLTGAYEVHGVIRDKWASLGSESSFLGYPVTDETGTPDGHGRFNHFQGGSIYWTPGTGAHEIFGAIRDKWASMGWERSPLGYPVDHEQPTFDGVGRSQNFQGGMISWHPEIGAFVVWGLIGARWLELGGPQFGYPVTDEIITPDGVGRYNHFRAMQLPNTPDASIYWTPATGAHEVIGAIRDKWAFYGWERGTLGYPTGHEQDIEGGRTQNFQNGRIDWVGSIAQVTEIHLETSIETPGGFPLGGEAQILLKPDGTYIFSGFMRATGLTSYHFGVQVFLKASNGLFIAAQKTGHVFGTDTPGDRQRDWNETGKSVITNQWDLILKGASIEYIINADIAGVIGTAWDGLKMGVEALITAYTVGPIGAIVFIGYELGGAAGVQVATPDNLLGLAVVAGTVMLFGPGFTIPAIVGGVAVVELSGIKHKSISTEEIIFAQSVFLDKLPYSRIVLTNLSHGGGNAYTIPSLDGSILVNITDEAYENPIDYPKPGSDYSQKGSLFIHELTHAWQIAHTNFLPAMLIEGGTYDYHAGDPKVEKDRLKDISWASKAWSEFNLEQQAHIIDDWFGAFTPDLNSIAAINDPAFKYIADNIRVGRL